MLPKNQHRTAACRRAVVAVVVCALAVAAAPCGCGYAALSDNAAPPKRPIKLVFIHHSCGENWLADDGGGLGRALAASNYFVSDTNYGWGPAGIGDRTDIVDWPEWFLGPDSEDCFRSLLRENQPHCDYARPLADPGGENRIVMFKSCFPNSDLAGRPTDRPARGDGLTVANAKAIYMQLLDRFARRPDKLFIVVTAPPLQDRTHAANARALNDWLVHQWLADYTGRNVAVFDFYNVLTARDHHHRVRSGKIEHVHRAGHDTLAYPTGDDHPSRLGNRKATDEFVPLLNVYVNRWIATAPAEPAVMTPPTPTPPRNTPWTVRPQATDPAPAAQTSTIDDFEQGPRGWACFRDEANPATRLDFAVDAGVTHTGKASMRVDYNIAPESWATCSLVFDRVQDWSDADGLSLQVRPATAGQRVTIVAYGGSVDDLQHFESSVEIVPSKDGWQRLDIPWSQLEPAAWQSDADVPFNPRAAMGIALAFDAPDGQPNIGRLWIDEVKLLAKPSQ